MLIRTLALNVPIADGQSCWPPGMREATDSPTSCPSLRPLDAHLYAFSAARRRMDASQSQVSIQDEHGQGRGWRSVVVDGRYEELPDRMGHKLQRDHAWSLLSKHSDWWEPGALKPVVPPVSDKTPHVFFRILIEQVSGREASE